MTELHLDLGHQEPAREINGERVVRKAAVLADPPLHAAARAAEHAQMGAARGDEVDGDLLGGAEPQRLGGDLGVAVEDNIADLTGADTRALALSLGDIEGVARSADLRSLRDDV